VKIKFLGTHNAESKYTKLVSLLIDDILAVDTGSLTSELSFSEQEKIKAILLSHGHYDHIRDVPAFAFNNACRTTKVFGTPETLEILSSHLVDGVIYPKFTEYTPICEKQSLQLVPLEPFIPVDIEGYQVLALPVNHPGSSVGFEITSKNDKKIFYSGDTNVGLSDIWEHISPQLIIMEVTFPNKLENVAKNSSHLCPKTLKKELKEFHRIKGYYPRIILIHLTPNYKKEIKREIKEVAKELQLSIDIPSDGEEIIV
jgi:ribonuclease BN (tRNA processing enzyme)